MDKWLHTLLAKTLCIENKTNTHKQGAKNDKANISTLTQVFL